MTDRDAVFEYDDDGLAIPSGVKESELQQYPTPEHSEFVQIAESFRVPPGFHLEGGDKLHITVERINDRDGSLETITDGLRHVREHRFKEVPDKTGEISEHRLTLVAKSS